MECKFFKSIFAYGVEDSTILKASALFPQTGKNEINYFVKNFVFK